MALVISIIDFLRRERDYRRTRSSLHSLDDRLLRDIGVRRDQIDSLAFQLREAQCRRADADARSRRNEETRRRPLDGRGLAAQH